MSEGANCVTDVCPVRDRAARWLATMGRVCLWDVGGSVSTMQLIEELDWFHFFCVRAMLERKTPQNGTRAQRRTGPQAKLRLLLRKWGLRALGAEFLALHHAWSGHACRLAESTLRNLALRGGVPGVLRRLAGRPFKWDAHLRACFGEAWSTLALNRAAWNATLTKFLSHQAAGNLSGMGTRCQLDAPSWTQTPGGL
jgi:hypothetical protein